ncbi:MAG: hypothetical protein WCA37_17015 [Terracidiphilus sp.]
MELRSNCLLKLADLDSECRWRNVERMRSARKVPDLRCRQERFKMTDVVNHFDFANATF